ncbi:MAG: two pore domain potassium channel family protein [Acholeplasmatales bacterium]|nr:two pore domain potassium channel family protein [Acholeplasmatales bacterium]
MAKKEDKKKKNELSKDNVYLILNLVLAVITMALAAALTGKSLQENADFHQVALFLGLTIFSQILFQCLLFVVKDSKRDKIRAVVVGIIYIGAMITAFAASKENYLLFYIADALILLALAVNQFMQINKEKTKKGIITNILLGVVLVLLTVAVFDDITEEDLNYVPLLAVIIFLFTSFKKILFPSLKLEKIRLLLNILVKTHTFDILICLLAFMIAFSFILPRFELSITNFWDGMWYCFTVITTIGFGDFVATTPVGRLLTVILGIYGIVVVAILTSVIVNFYNEVSAKERARDIIE